MIRFNSQTVISSVQTILLNPHQKNGPTGDLILDHALSALRECLQADPSRKVLRQPSLAPFWAIVGHTQDV